jgi:hypothetical protein
MHYVGYRYCCHLPGLEFIYLPQTVEYLPFQGRQGG